MNKDSIYKIIGYEGEYNKEVKAKLRKLLKKYHPDHNNGESEIFKLINEIKKELEHNINIKIKNVNIKTKKAEISKDNFQYYENQIKKLLKQNELLRTKINNKNSDIEKISKRYNLLNEKLSKNQGILCENNDNVNYLKKFQKKYIVYILSLIISIIIYLLKKNILFIGLISIIIIILTIDVGKLYLSIKEITSNSNDYLKKNFDLFKDIEHLKDRINEEKRELLVFERELIKNNNDIRFYQNQLNKK